MGIEPEWNLVRHPVKQKKGTVQDKACTFAVLYSICLFQSDMFLRGHTCLVIFQIAYLFRGSIEPLVFRCTIVIQQN